MPASACASSDATAPASRACSRSSPARSRPTAGRSGAPPACACRGSTRTSPALPIEPCSTRSRPVWARSVTSWRDTTMRPCTTLTAEKGLARLGELQHELEERDGWRLEQRVETVVSRLSLPADRSDRRALGRLAPAHAARQGAGLAAGSAAPRRADEPSRHRSDPVAGVLPARVLRRVALRHPRPRVPVRARDAHRRARSRHA